MDQTRAINALAPFVALAKSASSPRAAADLVTQATSSPNAYVFSELLQQPNIQKLAGHKQYGNFYTQLQMFAWGTWESYKATPDLPELSDPQKLKLRLLSLLTIASEPPNSNPQQHNLTYASLCSRLDLESTVDLEHLVTQAIYNDLILATLNPANQTVIITSVAPLRDLAPGSVQSMISELAAWSGRCDSVLSDLEAEIERVKTDAIKRRTREARADKQIKAAVDSDAKGDSKSSGVQGERKSNRQATKREQDEDDYDDDEMDIDGGGNAGGSLAAGGKKRIGGSLRNMFKR